METVSIRVSRDSVQKAVRYFSELELKKGVLFGLFFYLKGLGLENRSFSLLPPQKDPRTSELFSCLGAMFDGRKEAGGKYTVLFPFAFPAPDQNEKVGRNRYYNGGTTFPKLPVRVNDTVDNTLVDSYVQKSDVSNKEYRFVPEYLEILEGEEYLNGRKLSFRHFLAWFFRFTTFDVPSDWVKNPTMENSVEFTSGLKKLLIEKLKLSDKDLEKLFQDDGVAVEYSSTGVSGEYLRSLFEYEPGFEPQVTAKADEGIKTQLELPWDSFNEYLTPRGRNITPEALERLLIQTKQVILAGPPGTGKSYISSIVRKNFAAAYLLQFHPNLTYEQFIGGTTFLEDGNVGSRAGVFLEFCETARSNPDKKFLFLIDEINRGNVSKVFGETIMALDREYVLSLPVSLEVRGNLLENQGFVTRGFRSANSFSIPGNVYILATMNSADRSIALVDYAIRRRFAFVTFYPNSEIVDSLSDYNALNGVRVGAIMDGINRNLMNVLGDPNLLLGQSYFMPKWLIEGGKYAWDKSTLKKLFYYYILPILEEYTYGNQRYLMNILGDKLTSVIQDDDEFMEELISKFGR